MDAKEMLAEALSRGNNNQARAITMTPVSGKERERLTKQLTPIKGLKAGDKLRWKDGMRDSHMPEYGETVEVFRVFETPKTGGDYGSNHFCDENDFSVLFRCGDSGLVEYAFDSRKFERVA